MRKMNYERHLSFVCFYGCTVHKERSERISIVWIQGFVRKRRKGYTCEPVNILSPQNEEM